jgi:segregation and condensation protein A
MGLSAVGPSSRRRGSAPPPIAVSFGEGRRPEQATRVRVGMASQTNAAGVASQPVTRAELPADAPGSFRAGSSSGPERDPIAFEGPLALLLSLIEARQLDVLTVPLGALAGAYLEALARLDGERLAYLSAFVAVAAQLIVIKSRALLPRTPAETPAELSDEGPDPEVQLRRRLILYRAYRDAGAWLAERARTGGPLFRREPSVAQAAGLAGARPSAAPALDPALLVAALRSAVQLAPPAPPPPEVLRRTITLAERADAIRAAIRRAPIVVLQDLLGATADRVLAAVTFLAMLELVKRREIAVEQDRPWGPIRCRSLEPGGLVAGPESAPIDETLEGYG